VSSFFVRLIARGLGWGSGPGGSIVASYHLKKKMCRDFQPGNSVLNTQIETQAFDVMHVCIVIIQSNANDMTFR
jgi:hypothetical protein